MSRQRFIHPEIWGSEDFSALSHTARLLFIALFSLADDEGRGKGAAKTLSGAAFPGEGIEIGPLMAEIEARGMVRTYTVGGNSFYWMPNWEKYQKPKYPRPSKIPAPRLAKSSRKIPPSLPQASPMGWVGLGRDGLLPSVVRPSDSQRGVVEQPAASAAVVVQLPLRAGFADTCFRSWQDRHDERPPWGKAEYAALASAVKRCHDDRDLADTAWSAFLGSDDPFYAGHDPKKFLNSISTWVCAKDPISTGLLPRRTVQNIRAAREAAVSPELRGRGGADARGRSTEVRGGPYDPGRSVRAPPDGDGD